MDKNNDCPTDGSPCVPLKQAVMITMAAYLTAFLLNPGSVGRWAYMLPDGEWTRPFQVAGQAVSWKTVATLHLLGLPVVFDIAKDAASEIRETAGASP